MLVIYFIYQAWAGTIWPTQIPIQMTIANRYEYADYTFTMIADTAIPRGGQIDVVFPDQYLAGLGIDLVQYGTCSEVCAIKGLTVTFTLETDVIVKETVVLKVYQVRNPEAKGGTSNFVVRSKLGQNIFDENLIFGTVGIADYALDFNSMIIKVDENSTNVVGQQSLYNFYIKPPITLPAGFYLNIKPPFNSDLSTCKFITFNNTIENYNVTCSGQIIIKGFKEVQALDVFAIQINFKNPAYAQTTQPFRVVAYRKDTSLVYSWRNSVDGIIIVPGTLINSTIVAGSVAAALTVDYTLTFITFNIVPSNGSISVTMPVDYELAYQTTYDYVSVEVGIIADSLIIKYDLYGFQISNFTQIASNTQIVIRFRGKNPQTQGKSQPFIVKTLQGTNVIDQSINNLYITTVDALSMLPQQATLSSPSAGTATNFQFAYNPNKNIGVSLTIDFPTTWTIGTTVNTNCLIAANPSTSCVTTAQQIVLTYPITSKSTISFNGILTSPPNQIDQLVYYVTKDSAGKPLEYGSVRVQVKPLLDATATFQIVGKELSTSVNKRYSTLYVKFTIKNAIPVNIIVPTPVDPNAVVVVPDPSVPVVIPPIPSTGQIWLQFGPLLTWDNNLGLTKVNCLTDLVPLDNMTITCTLIPGTQSTFPEIIIKNFKALAANTIINIQIPGLLSPEVSPLQFAIYSGKRQYSERLALDYATQSVPLVAGAVPWNAVSLNGFTVTTASVGTKFTCTFTPGFTVSIPASGKLRIQLPTYDVGFLTNQTKCLIDGVAHPCTLFPGIDWIEINVATLVTAATNKVTLQDLQWPPTSASVDFIKWLVFVSSAEQEKGIAAQIDGSKFPAPVPNDFSTATITKYSSGKGQAGQIFSFNFTTPNTVPTGAVMSITFPPEFNLKDSVPTPSCNGYDVNAISVSGNGPFIVICIGIKTPFSPPDDMSDGWGVEILVSGRLLNRRLNFFFYTYGNLFSEGTIQILSLQSQPVNQNEIATYSIGFSMANMILKKGRIEITFPSTNFPELPYPPNLADCDLQGAIDSFESCLLVGSTYVIILNSIYTSGLVTFSLNNVKNPAVTISDGFIIKTYYDSLLLDATDESTLLNRTVSYTPQAMALVVNTLSCSPMNMGVKAIYYFNLTLSAALTIDQQLVITFPNGYDQRLGDNLKGMINTKSVNFSVNNRIVTFKQDNYGTQLFIVLQNIVNPNTQVNANTGSFRLGIMQNGYYVYYNNSAGVLEMEQPPGWLYIRDIQLANQYSRWQSKYTFNFTLYNKLPEYLQIDFPSQYDISDAKATCNFNSCSYIDNVMKAYKDPINGDVSLTLTVENPLDEATISNLQLKSQNSRKIVEQSYPNLDPFSFIFKYSGPLIKVNQDMDIIMYQGTESADLYFSVTYPMALNLTFKHTQSGNFSVMPKDIVFDYTLMQVPFRVQVPPTLPEGTYYIYWNTLGEQSPPLYTPVRKSRVVVRKGTIPITLTQLFPIPTGGNSLNIRVAINNAPYDGMTILATGNDKIFYMSSDTGEYNSTINQLSLQFELGINYLDFRVQQNFTELQRQQQLNIVSEEDRIIYFSVSNKLYEPLNNLTVTFIAAAGIAPKIINVTAKTEDITQISALLQIQLDQVAEVYYMLCLNMTQQPELDELLSQGPPLQLSTQSQYGTLNVNVNGTLQVQLEAETNYTFYIVAINRENIVSKIFQTNFTSKPRYRIAELLLSSARPLNQAEVTNTLRTIALILSLPQWKITEKATYIQSTSTRLLDTLTIPIQIIPMNYTLDYPIPKEMGNIITAQYSVLEALLGEDIGFTSPIESISTIPVLSSVTIKDSSNYSCEIAVTPSIQGYAFAVASFKNQSTPYQIFKGLDNQNIQIPSAGTKLNNITEQTFTIGNLEPNRTYTIYVVSGSDLPEYPDLSPNVTAVTCTTKLLPERAPLQVISQNILIAIIIILQLLQ